METSLEVQACIAQIPRAHYSGKPVSLQIRPGEIVSILGPDYHGKTEWLRTFAGLNAPLQGEIISGGISTPGQSRQQWQQLRRALAYVSSETSLLSASNGIANVMLAAKYHQLGETPALHEKALALMTQLEVQALSFTLPAFMRRDQNYRLALARALMLDPAVLILENPFVHSDSAGSHRLKKFLLRRASEHHTAVLIMSHDIEFSLKYAQQILFVSREQVYCFANAEQFRNSPLAEIRQYLDKAESH